VIDWVDACLAAAGRHRTGELTLFRDRPWSAVHSAHTDAGTVWHKACAPEVAFEAGLYALLAQTVPDHVLIPLGIDTERGWLLLPDGGPVLRDRPAPIETVLVAYAELQRALAPRVEDLLALGVADMRPQAMPARYDEALAKTGLSPPVPRERFAAWCEELAASPGGASLDHNDLHSDNILPGDDGTVRFYDWGDAVVAHPFASMLVGLGALPADQVTRARDAYLEVFSDLGPHAELVRTLELACRVAKAARALIWHRAASMSDNPDWRDAPVESLAALADDSYLSGA
jgi:hypothetical protein